MDTINQCSDLWIDERYLVETKLGANGTCGGTECRKQFSFSSTFDLCRRRV